MYIKHQLKNGLTLDFDDEKHLYLFNGKKVESVTGICGNGVPKPELQGWLISTPVREIKNSINTLLDNGESLDRVILERIVDKAKNKTEEIKKDAGLIGTVVHGLIEDFLKNKKIPNQSDKKVRKWGNLG